MTEKQPINGTQIKLIHIAKGKLRMTDEEYRTMLSDRYWVNTSKGLSYKDASDLIDHFKTLGFKITAKRITKKPLPPSIPQLPSSQQMQRIDHLKKDIHWLVADGYNRWLVKYLKKTHITTGKEAQNVIEAMKAMKARQNGIDQKNNAPRPPLTSRGGA